MFCFFKELRYHFIIKKKKKSFLKCILIFWIIWGKYLICESTILTEIWRKVTFSLKPPPLLVHQNEQQWHIFVESAFNRIINAINLVEMAWCLPNTNAKCIIMALTLLCCFVRNVSLHRWTKLPWDKHLFLYWIMPSALIK